jgi:hypothetical protein
MCRKVQNGLGRARNVQECTSYEAPHYAVFSSLQLLSNSLVQIFSSAPCSQTP